MMSNVIPRQKLLDKAKSGKVGTEEERTQALLRSGVELAKGRQEESVVFAQFGLGVSLEEARKTIDLVVAEFTTRRMRDEI